MANKQISPNHIRQKRFIVRKFVIAKTVKEAIEKEKRQIADEVYLDLEWVAKQDNEVFGFENKKNAQNNLKT